MMLIILFLLIFYFGQDRFVQKFITLCLILPITPIFRLTAWTLTSFIHDQMVIPLRVSIDSQEIASNRSFQQYKVILVCRSLSLEIFMFYKYISEHELGNEFGNYELRNTKEEPLREI